MEKKSFLGIISRYLSGTASDSERRLVDAYYNKLSGGDMHDPSLSAEQEEAIRKSAFHNVRDQIRPKKSIITSLVRFRYAGVAALLLCATAATFYLLRPSAVQQGSDEFDASPGYSQASLTLANGKTIQLDSAYAGITIVDGTLIYDGGLVINLDAADLSAGSDGKSADLLTLKTPFGGNYRVTLPDGSQVWLNAGTTLKYPAHFSGKSRIVYVDGEAYFEVFSDKSKPFKVITAHQEITVLGTSFNVCAYREEAEEVTTLLQGSVKLTCLPLSADSELISAVGHKREFVLEPGEEVVYMSEKFEKSAVDATKAIAWKNGRFVFDNKPFVQVMAELGRWYDLEIEYEGSVPQEEFFGDALRDNNLSIVMKLLKSAHINYRLNGRTLTIKSKI